MYHIEDEFGFDKTMNIVIFPQAFSEERKYDRGITSKSAGVEKLGARLELFDNLFSSRKFDKNGKLMEDNVLTNAYGKEEWKRRYVVIKKLKYMWGAVEGYLRGLRSGEILTHDLKNPRMIKFKQATSKVPLFQPVLVEAIILLLRNSNLDKEALESRHYKSAGLAVQEMKFISRILKSKDSDDVKDVSGFDDAGNKKDKQYISENFV